MSDRDRRTPDGEGRRPGIRRHEVDAVGMPYHPVWSTFALLLHGPVLWAAHFLLVYLAAEWACAQGGGVDAAVAWTLWPTVVLGLGIVAGSAVTLSRWRDGRDGRDGEAAFAEDDTKTTHVDPAVRDHAMLGIGLMLGALSLIAVVAVGAMALVLPLC